MLTNNSSFLWPSDFSCTIISEKLIIPNFYQIRLSIEPNNARATDINLGFKKLKYFIHNCLSNSILINEKNTALKLFSEFDSNFIPLPTEPYDFFIANILFSKFKIITEKYFELKYLTLESEVGENVQYHVNVHSKMELEKGAKYWWNIDSITTGNNETPTWEELNLHDSPKFSPKVVQGGLSE